MYEKRKFNVPSFLFTKNFRILTITLFWVMMAVVLVASGGSVPALWLYFLQLMLSMVFLAIATQTLFGKRYFCKNLCPLRIPVLAPVMKKRNSALRFLSGQRDVPPSPTGRTPRID
jgi:polyferredoxin